MYILYVYICLTYYLTAKITTVYAPYGQNKSYIIIFIIILSSTSFLPKSTMAKIQTQENEQQNMKINKNRTANELL